MADHYILYSAEGSGGVAVEAALALIGAPHEVIEAPTYDPAQRADGDRVLAANPMRQVPALLTPGREVLTESAAILIWLAEQHPEAALAPAAGDPARGAFLRWMVFVSSAIYAHYWLKDDPSRLVADPALHADVDRRIQDRISDCWAVMEAGLAPGRYLLGDQLTVLDLYVAVVSRFRPRRERFYAAAPRMGEVVRRLDADPRLADLWARRYPFAEGWDRL
ncbi:MAG: glutathione S-transferase [Phenylobacterium sp. RIFCSPHIGHO2_01_FULL_69_31]|jgi:GST-like protein|uniref:glutathione S-transferase family protein n=1 Tax=Phenylobacterium sp. RIFCSPHIGHO2_01_FULL_69_31 TaxID=1801944 RepID=UPI0008BDF9D6|nr:glutathione S-transferase family protein [Phenylobacterium sp. RIFCSPHIGHO2_01_FULL_69_31]OHB30490.1 MAG: glutathione S-transferase [Phenylobacterium sp. RIFCSPHIGHO2_01_FULL_69_31]